uniref:Uncharacterized protein n=1 Tax=viral metagenome TaxID=1070528 RepID=A0A6C0LTJ8_9ZZZZ
MNIALHAIIGRIVCGTVCGTICGTLTWGFYKFMNFDFGNWELKRIRGSDQECDNDDIKLSVLIGTIFGAFIFDAR